MYTYLTPKGKVVTVRTWKEYLENKLDRNERLGIKCWDKSKDNKNRIF
jgi:hypothetical protein